MYNEFENAIIRGIYISRYVASWTNFGGTFTRVRQKCSLKDWLRTLSINGEKAYRRRNPAHLELCN